METSTVTRKGQVTIPARIRRRLGLEEGDRVAFIDEGDRVVLTPTEDDVTAAFGLLKSRKSVSLKSMEDAIRRRASR